MKNYIYFFIILLAFTFNACKDDCPVEPDPCSEYPEKMEITLMWPDYFLPNYNEQGFIETTNEIFAVEQLLQFKTNYDYDSIHWQFGSDPAIWKRNVVPLIFTKPVGKVTVFCKGFRSPNIDCFGAEDDGIDTITKTLDFKEWHESPLFGTYRGVNEGETDSFNVTIGLDSVYNQALDRWQLDKDAVFFQGLPKHTNSRKKIGIEYYEMFGFNSGHHDGIDDKYTYIRMFPENENEIEIHFQVYATKENKKFNGRRTN